MGGGYASMGLHTSLGRGLQAPRRPHSFQPQCPKPCNLINQHHSSHPITQIQPSNLTNHVNPSSLTNPISPINPNLTHQTTHSPRSLQLHCQPKAPVVRSKPLQHPPWLKVEESQGVWSKIRVGFWIYFLALVQFPTEWQFWDIR